MTKITHKEKHIFKEGQKLLSTGAVDPLVRLPKWAQRRIAELEEQVKRAEATTPWTAPGMEWFTLFWPGPEPKVRAPQRLFTCGDDGTHCVCTLGPDDYVFVGRGKKPNRTITMQRNDPAHRTPGAEHNQKGQTT